MPVGTGGLYSPWGCKESDTTERLSPHTEHIYICSICIYSSLPCSSVRQILQARILEWVVMHSCRVSSWPRDWTQSPTLQVNSLPSEPPENRGNIFSYLANASTSILTKVSAFGGGRAGIYYLRYWCYRALSYEKKWVSQFPLLSWSL